jgi:TonB family protein
MQSTGKGNPGPEQARSDLALGRCLVEGDPDATSPARRSRRRAFGISLAIETSLLMLFVAAPLLTSVAQPQLHQNPPSQLTFFGVWRGHNPAQHAATPTTVRRPAIPNPFLPTAPPVTTVEINRVEDPADASIPELPEGYVPGAIQITEGRRTPPPVEPPHIAPPAQPEKRPVKVSEGVLQAQLVSRIEPRYPLLALQTRQTGTVVLHAIISRDGRINALEVVSGSPFFVQAVLDAVRQWRYRPTMLNGEPVEIDTTITVIFQLKP